jgi:hypothetical protein
MTAAWPATLPAYVLEQGFSEAMPDQFIETPMEAGRSKTRRRYTTNNRIFTVTVAMTLAQRLIFEAFFDADLRGGSLPFTWVHPLHRTNCTMRIRKPVPKFSVRGEAHLLAMGLEIVG